MGSLLGACGSRDWGPTVGLLTVRLVVLCGLASMSRVQTSLAASMLCYPAVSHVLPVAVHRLAQCRECLRRAAVSIC